jgi:hypothetical protein
LNKADRADKLGDIEKLVTKLIKIELTLITCNATLIQTPHRKSSYVE